MRGYTSVDNTEWICHTCLSCIIKEGNYPNLSFFNKMTFPVRPHELEHHQLEEILIALRIRFMQICELSRGGQLSVKGNVVNVPVDIQPTVNALPRQLDINVIVPMNLKKKLIYKKSDFTENVRPAAVISGLHWLMKNSDLYKNVGIVIEKDWVAKVSQNEKSMNKSHMNNSYHRILVEMNVTPHKMKKIQMDLIQIISVKLMSKKNLMVVVTQCQMIQILVQTSIHLHQEKGLYQDPDAEYLAFPSIFCGQKSTDNAVRTVPIHYSDIVKWELRNVDRRVANNVPNIFFKMKKLQMKQVSDKVNLALRRCKTKGRKITAEQALNPETVNNIVRLDVRLLYFQNFEKFTTIP